MVVGKTHCYSEISLFVAMRDAFEFGDYFVMLKRPFAAGAGRLELGR